MVGKGRWQSQSRCMAEAAMTRSFACRYYSRDQELAIEVLACVQERNEE